MTAGRPDRSDAGVLAPLAAAVRIDRGGLRPGPAVKAAAGVAIPLAAGIALNDPTAGATAAFGALSVGIAMITAGPRVPVGTMLAASLGMGLATFVGSVTGLVPALHLITLAAAGFLAGLLVAAGRGATQVGVNATIALLVFGRFPAHPGPAAVHMTWVLAGGLLQTGLAVAARSPRPLHAQRTALAAAYDALAAGASREQLPLAAAESAATARDTIAPWLHDEDRPQAGPLRGLADELDRIRQEVHALQFQRATELSRGPARAIVAQALAELSAALTEVAAALRSGRRPAGTEPRATRLLALADQLAEAAGSGGIDGGGNPDGTNSDRVHGGDPGGSGPDRIPDDVPSGNPGGSLSRAAATARFCAARVAALAGQVRAVSLMATALAGVRRITLPAGAATAAEAVVVLPGSLMSALRQVRAAASPASPAFRHAVRLAVVIPVASEISRLLPWQRGYWLPVAAVIVLRPDFAATVSRGVARTVGTGAGVVAGAVIVAALHPQGTALAVLIGACAWLGYTVFAASYALYAVFLTTLVILLVSAAQASAMSAVENRGFDTLIGGGLAIAAYLIWPTWEARTLQAATVSRFEAIGRYLDAVLAAYLDPATLDVPALAGLAAATRRAQSSVTASLDRARGEPARNRADVGTYAGVIAAGRRIVAGTHALASHLQDASRQVAVPAAGPMAAQLSAAMTGLVQAIGTGSPPADLPDLRRAHRQLTAATAAVPGGTPASRRGTILVALLDPLVDSIDTAAHLLGASSDDLTVRGA